MTDTIESGGRTPVTPSKTYVAAWTVLGSLAAGYVAIAAGHFPGISGSAMTTVAGQEAGERSAIASGPPVAGPTSVAAAGASSPVVQPIAITVPAREPVAVAVTGSVAPTLLNGTTTDAPAPAKTRTVAVQPPPDPLAKVQEFLASAPTQAESASAPVTTTGSLPGLRPAPAPAPAAKPLPKVTNLAPRLSAEPTAAPVTGRTIVAPSRAGPVGIVLGGNTSLDEVRARWAVTSARNATLSTLEPRVIATDALGSQSFSLVAGPIATKADAAKVCAELKAEGVACRVGGYTGQPF